MKVSVLKWLMLMAVLSSCGTAKDGFDRKQYRKSKPVATYLGGTNELQDGYVILKENGYFEYYEKTWLLFSIKHSGYMGRYSQSADTLYLNWHKIDPKKIKYYLSKKCVIDPRTKSLWFVDEQSDEMLWRLHLKK